MDREIVTYIKEVVGEDAKALRKWERLVEALEAALEGARVDKNGFSRGCAVWARWLDGSGEISTEYPGEYRGVIEGEGGKKGTYAVAFIDDRDKHGNPLVHRFVPPWRMRMR